MSQQSASDEVENGLGPSQHGGSQQGDGGPGSPGKVLKKPAGKATKPKAKGKAKGGKGW